MLDSTRTLLIAERRRLVHGYLKDNHPHLPSSSLPFIFPLYHPSSVDILLHWEIPDQGRSGHLLSTGLFLGAEHAALEDIIQEVQEAKPKRNMFAETAREREEILGAVRASEWNMEMNPIVTFVSGTETVFHNFVDGYVIISNALYRLYSCLTRVYRPCSVPVTFDFRNFSMTHDARFTLRLSSPETTSSSSNLLSPIYSGRLCRTGELKPGKGTKLTVKMQVRQPGAYSISNWRTESEVLEDVVQEQGDTEKSQYPSESRKRRVRRRYTDLPSRAKGIIITVLQRV